MNKIGLFLTLAVFSTFTHAGSLTIPKTYINSEQLLSADLNANMNAIQASVNGNAADIVTLTNQVKPGITFTKLHAADELGLRLLNGTNFTDIGSIAAISGLLLEWRMANRPEVFQQFIHLTNYDKDIITGAIATPVNYPRQYTIIVGDNFGSIIWIAVSISRTTLTLTSSTVADPQVFLERIYSFK